MQGSSVFNWLGGITTIVLVGIVVSNGGGVGQILTGLGNLYRAAAQSAHPQSSKFGSP